MEKFEVTRECSNLPVVVPYRYLTPSGCELDLRLWDRGLLRKALPTLIAILERETRGWFLHFRERLIAELRAQKMSDEDIEKVSFPNFGCFVKLVSYLVSPQSGDKI